MKERKPRHDITGQVFGDLKVVSMKWETKQFVAVCDCLSCGKKDVIAIPNHIKSGHKKSCGCKAKFVNEDIVGEKFGMLSVIELEKKFHPTYNNGKGKFKYYALCKCDCGNEHRVLKASLKRGSTTSCGCRRDQYDLMRGENHSQYTGYKEIRGKKWSDYQNKAKKRNLDFDITIEEAWGLYEEQNRKCALTKLPIKHHHYNGGGTASLDRIDSSKGYNLENVQWLHKDVNKMKMDFPQERFLEICCLVSSNGED